MTHYCGWMVGELLCGTHRMSGCHGAVLPEIDQLPGQLPIIFVPVPS